MRPAGEKVVTLASIDVAVLGFGNVGRAFAQNVTAADRSSIRVRAVADSSGATLIDKPDNIAQLIRHKQSGLRIAEMIPGDEAMAPRELIQRLPALGITTLVECLPTNLVDGQPALDLIQAALRRGINVVTVDKGPLVHGFQLLNQAAQTGGSGFGFTGTVGVPIPEGLDRVIEIRGVLNGTSNYILSEMQEQDLPFDQALAQAQVEGIAEPLPSLDTEGWDTVCKVLILAKAVMRADVHLKDVTRIGIGPHTDSLIRTARASGRRVRLIGRARIWKGKVRVSVAPKLVDADSPFYSIGGTGKAALFKTAGGAYIASHAHSGRDAIAGTIVEDIMRILSR
jgi:homoserine dehydrogenase